MIMMDELDPMYICTTVFYHINMLSEVIVSEKKVHKFRYLICKRYARPCHLKLSKIAFEISKSDLSLEYVIAII